MSESTAAAQAPAIERVTQDLDAAFLAIDLGLGTLALGHPAEPELSPADLGSYWSVPLIVQPSVLQAALHDLPFLMRPVIHMVEFPAVGGRRDAEIPLPEPSPDRWILTNHRDEYRWDLYPAPRTHRDKNRATVSNERVYGLTNPLEVWVTCVQAPLPRSLKRPYTHALPIGMYFDLRTALRAAQWIADRRWR